MQALLYVALDQNYISNTKFNELYSHGSKIKKLIGGLKKYLSGQILNDIGPSTLDQEQSQNIL